MPKNQESSPNSSDPFLLLEVGSGDETRVQCASHRDIGVVISVCCRARCSEHAHIVSKMASYNEPNDGITDLHAIKWSLFIFKLR